MIELDNTMLLFIGSESYSGRLMLGPWVRAPQGSQKMGQRRSWRGGTDCNNRVNCHKSLIGNRLEVSRYHTPLQSQSVAYG